MCCSPVKIRNNKLDWSPMFDRYYIVVPCNHCYECNRQKRQSTEVLLKSHYFLYKNRNPYYSLSSKQKRTLGKLGNMFYITLTYNPESLPLFDSKPCFDHRHIQLFLKRLRKRIAPLRLQYYIVSEYGGKYGRPHYHAIFFTEGFYTSWNFRQMIQSTWTYGFIYGSKNKLTNHDQTIIDNTKPFAYVTKYVTKDYRFYDDFKDVDLPSHNFPRVFHSNFIGLNSINFIKDDEIHLDNKVYPLPLYIIRKLYYDKYVNRNGNVGFCLNQSGLDFKLRNAVNYVNTLRSRYQSMINLIDYYDLSSYLNISNDIIKNSLLPAYDFVNYSLFQHCYNKFHPVFNDYKSSLMYHFNRDSLPFLPHIKDDNIYDDVSFEFSNYIYIVLKYIKSYHDYKNNKNNNVTYQRNLADSTKIIIEEKETPEFRLPLPNHPDIYNLIYSFNSF